MKFKKLILNLESEIDLKTWSSLNKSHNSYNDIKFYLLHDEENPKIKYVIYMFDENSKIVRETKGKSMKQSEFQQYVIEQFKEQKKFNDYVEGLTAKYSESTDNLDLNELDLNKMKYSDKENHDIDSKRCKPTVFIKMEDGLKRIWSCWVKNSIALKWLI